ncbi:MAG TPA: hypothetical protein VF790_07345, partial [Dissulfurispiraceae bacterium]
MKGRRTAAHPVLLAICCLVCIAGGASFAQEQAAPKQPQQASRSLEEERLDILKTDLQKEIDQYKQLKKEFEDTQKALDEQGRARLQKVVKMYEAMPAEDAAKKLESLDEGSAVAILSAMKPKTAGKILAQMDNEKAANISRRILT